MAEEQRRAAERVELQKPIAATLGDVPAKIVEISLINCRIEHTGKVAMGSNVTLQFDWSGEKVKLKGKLTRSEMRTIGGTLNYVSSMQFADSIEKAPPVVRRLIASLLGQAEASATLTKPEPEPAPVPAPPKPKPAAASPKPAPAVAKPTPVPAKAAAPFVQAAEEIEEIEAEAELPAIRYVQCSLEEGKWAVREVVDPRQPREGFTMIAPDDPKEIDQFCKTYEVADSETRRMIRLSFELAIAHVNG